MQISKIVDGNKFSFEKMKGSYGLLISKIDEPGVHTFSIAQMGERMVDRDSKYEYSDGRMIIMRLNGQDPTNLEAVEYIAGTNNCYRRDIHLEVNVKPGTYVVCVEIDWCAESKPANKQFTVTCYGPSQVHFQNVASKYGRDDVVKAAILSIHG